MEDAELRRVLISIQDHLAPQLDSYEQMLYHYLFRHSHLAGKRDVEVGVRSMRARVGLGIGKAGSPPSEARVSEKLRSLEKKGCIRIIGRSRNGTHVEVHLPHEIPGVVPDSSGAALANIDALDFFTIPENRGLLLEREGHRCFYCLRRISTSDFQVDHVSPQAEGLRDHSYRNTVATCFNCNSRKRDSPAEDLLRELYREGLLSSSEHSERVAALEKLRSGRLVPSAPAAQQGAAADEPQRVPIDT